MAPRASWKGYLKLSLVSCPVRLYPATSSSERISFNQLHKNTHNRINMKPVDPELGLVERSDLVKGYEYEDKKYIIIDDADLESVRIESNHTMNIEAFVDERSVDVIYLDAPYYLAPDGAMAEETFVVLREALRKSGKLAIARLVLSSRERVITIGARETGMFVCTLRNPSEVRGTAEYFGNIPVGNPDPEMLQLAEALIQQKLTTFDPRNYEDRYEVGADADDPRETQGAQADHCGGSGARQCHQPHGRFEGEPFAIETAGQEQEQGGARRQGQRRRPSASANGEARCQDENLMTVCWPRHSASWALSAAFPRRLAAREVERQHGHFETRCNAPDLASWSSAGVCSTKASRSRDRSAVR